MGTLKGSGCHVEPHGDGNQQVLIIPNVWYPAVPYASCFAPSCVPSKVSRVLLGGWPVGRPQILQGLAAQLRDLCNVLLSSTDPLQVVVAQGHEVTYHSGRWDGPKPCEPIVCASPCASSAWCSATPTSNSKSPNERPLLLLPVSFAPTPKTFRSGYQRNVRSVYLSARKIVAGPQAKFATFTT